MLSSSQTLALGHEPIPFLTTYYITVIYIIGSASDSRMESSGVSSGKL